MCHKCIFRTRFRQLCLRKKIKCKMGARGWVVKGWQLEVGCSREGVKRSQFWGIQEPRKMRLADLAELSDLFVLFIQLLHSLLVFWQYSCGPFEEQWTDMSIKGGQGIIVLRRISSIFYAVPPFSVSILATSMWPI